MGEIIRAHGKGYIIWLVFKYTFLLGLLGVSSLCFIAFANESDSIGLTACIFVAIVDLFIVFLLVLQTREIIRYKMIIYDDSLFIKANRDIFLKRHKDMTVKFENICSLQYFLGMRFDLIDYGQGFCSIIIINYNNGNSEYIVAMRFSRKQIKYIMQKIKDKAEKLNGSEVEILPELNQLKTK